MLDVEGAEEFAEAVLDRFRNPHIRHALIDITLQATMKMRVRVVPSIQGYVAQHGSVPQSLAFGFASFIEFIRGRFQAMRREQGLSVPADDQGDRVRAHWDGVPDDASAPVDELVRAVCGDVSLWGADLGELPGFCAAVSDHLCRIRSDGMASALDHHLAHSS